MIVDTNLKENNSISFWVELIKLIDKTGQNSYLHTRNMLFDIAQIKER